MSLKEKQDRVYHLLENCEPKENLYKFVRGYIPKHYKKISLSREEQLRLAKLGASALLSYFDVKPFFTQAIIVGLMIDQTYHKVDIITPSQYGKSFILSKGNILLSAIYKKECHLAGANKKIGDIIMKHVIKDMQVVDPTIKNKLLNSSGKVERLDTQTSKNKISFFEAGSIDIIGLGDSSSMTNLKQSDAIGVGGVYTLDEADQVSKEASTEASRSEWSSIDGEKELFLSISNPHYGNEFMDDMERPYSEIKKGEAVIWMDIRTAVEEGRWEKDHAFTTKFFKLESTVTRYLLCEMDRSNENSMFNNPIIDDSALNEDDMIFLGLDTAKRGIDKIPMVVGAVNKDLDFRIVEIENIKPDGEWIENITPDKIINKVVNICINTKARAIAIDDYESIYIIEGIRKRIPYIKVYATDFGSSPTKERVKQKQETAEKAFNKRAEMHLDFQQMIEYNRLSMTSDVYEKLRDQMNATKTMPRGKGKIGIIPKDDIKKIINRSPDELDGSILCLHSFIRYIVEEGYYWNVDN